MTAPYAVPSASKPTSSTVQGPPPSQPGSSPLVVKLAEILLAGYALAKTAQLVKALLGASVGLPAVEAALGLAKSAHKAQARYAANGIDPAQLDPVQRKIIHHTRNEDVYFRAAYVANASRRIQARVDGGASFRDAIKAERPNYAAHVAARRNRLDTAAAVGTASLLFGPTLGWYRDPALDSDADCIAADGCNFYADTIPVIGLPGAVHPHCFPAGTLVTGPAPDAAFLRRYSGSLVEIRTQSGNVLAGTPNHPVLTSQGWAPLGEIRSGDHVVRGTRCEGLTSVAPHSDEQPAAIENRAKAIRVPRGMAAERVEVTAEDFHGDGSAGEVEVVLADSALRRQVQLLDPRCKEDLVRADDYCTLLTDLGLHLKFGVGSPRASYGSVRRFSIRAFLVWRERIAPRLRRFLQGAETNAALDQDVSDCLSADFFLASEGGDALPGEVALDQIIEIRRYPFEGHVYNLSTTVGWYLANGIVVHNCGCHAGPPHANAMMVDEAVASLWRGQHIVRLRRAS